MTRLRNRRTRQDPARDGLGETAFAAQAPGEGQSATAGPGVLLRQALGALLILAGLVTVYQLPGPSLIYLLLSVGLVAVLLWRPESWLLVLPAVVPTLDPGLWTGRLFFNEMDALVLIVVGSFLVGQKAFSFRSLGVPPRIYLLFLLVASIGTAIALLPPPAFTSHTPFDYLSPYNAVRVVRPMLWALLLWWPLAYAWQRNSGRCAELLLSGFAIGLIGFGTIILWERGVFLAIVSSFNPYAILEALLDTTTAYRVTGVFAEMHTGGTAVDAYLSLAVPLACAGTIVQRKWPLRLLCFVALLVGLYAAMATFSRALYLALGLSLAYYLFVFVGKVQEQIGLRSRTKTVILLSLLVLLGVAYASFVLAGYFALGLVLFTFFAVVGLRYALPDRLNVAFFAVAGVLGALIFFQLQGTFVESRYNPLASGQASLVAGIVTLLVLATSVPLAMAVRPIARPVYAFPALAVFAMICLVAIPPFTGYRMETRFATAQQDFTGRLDHWATTFGFLGESPLSYAFGISPGAFPRHYFWSDRRREERISYVFSQEGGESFLRLSGGDFNVTQKLPIRPETNYRLEARVRAMSEGANLVVSLCPKLVLFFHRWQPNCLRASERPAEVGQWQELSVEVNSGRLGAYWPFSLPPTVMLSSGGMVDVTDVRVSNDWENLVANGDFSSAGDYWIMASDFNHLSWHAKNLFLHVLVENGVLGLLFFLAAILLALARLSRARASQALLANGLVAALLSFLLVGLFGTLIDNTRPALLFYLVLLWALTFRRGDVATAAARRQPQARRRS